MDLAYQTPSGLYRNRRALLLCGFICACLLACSWQGARAQDDAATRQALINQKQGEIKALQAQIDQYQADVSARQKMGQSLENQIAIYDGSIAQNQLEIRETKMNVEAAQLEIAEAQARIASGQDAIERDHRAIRQYLQDLYGYQQQSTLEVLIEHGSLSDFWGEVGAVESVQGKLMATITALRQERLDLTARSQQLEDKQADYDQLIDMRSSQNAELEDLKAQKNEMLEMTNGEEDKYQALLAQNKNLLPSLRSELQNLQSLGQSIKFDDAVSAARYVGSVTGVRPALLLAILRVESGLGTNVGGGNYQTDMSPSQRPVFEAIARELGRDPASLPVSKKPKNSSGWGGAIGPAQMLPSTWRSYQARTAKVVGHMPDPWSVTDSLAAIAVKLADVPGVTEGNRVAEYQAAGIYVAGSNWQKFTYYPQKVMTYADLYEKELSS